MPSFLDFVFPFGEQEYAQDFYFTGFKEECLLGAKHRGLVLSELGRSGSEMRLCFNLRSVEESPRQVGLPWSIRQTAVYHTFDFETGKSVWITVKGSQDIKKRISNLVKPWNSSTYGSIADAFEASLNVHLLICNWSLENWRWYINDLERDVHSSTQMALSTVVDRPPSPQPTISPTTISPPTSPRSHSGTFSGFSRVPTISSIVSPRSKPREFNVPSFPPSRKHSNISQAQTATDESTRQGSSAGRAEHIHSMIKTAMTSVLGIINRPKNWRGANYDPSSSSEKMDSPTLEPGVRKEPPNPPPELGDEETPHPSGKFAFSDLQHILFIERKAQEAAVILQLNLGVLEELRQHYVYVAGHPDCPSNIKAKCDISRFEKSIRGIEKELRLQHSRFETFSRLLSEHKTLLNSILQYRGMEASIVFSKKAHESAVKMEALTSNMNDIAQKTRQETVSMRIITLVTLFFLPGTFIGTFMSTDIIKFEPGNVRHFQPQGLKVYLAICLPMMFVTFLAWYFVYRSVDRGQKKKDAAAADCGYATIV
ncbi:hypothetical protein K469DRAFT_710295 [Zopfia rhizophila CBS 207.26]|uniref:CorA-like transporter domain-containing protein n=1 Tax=Zopfia rhizophila CBS 207.26 TaxID=1314779 RepID=A0A6A6DWG5_9PEZI|nr:hypothetical protein K469DRAFT_710295 [Zopfia rhizophila CBS 207.26]